LSCTALLIIAVSLFDTSIAVCLHFVNPKMPRFHIWP
jgi:hypothetical protein